MTSLLVLAIPIAIKSWVSASSGSFREATLKMKLPSIMLGLVDSVSASHLTRLVKVKSKSLKTRNMFSYLLLTEQTAETYALLRKKVQKSEK